MIDYSELYQALELTPARRWLKTLPAAVERELNPSRHGSLKGWMELLQSLPEVPRGDAELNQKVVTANNGATLNADQISTLRQQLKTLMPWRKGPYSVCDQLIDTEWRSDMKWDRLLPHISPLKDKLVLDVGCGSGYHCFRMLGEGANRVVGIDPTLLFVIQFQAIKHFMPPLPVDVLPVTLDDMPINLCGFDTVFSMGVLYHRRSPIDHLIQLRDSLQPGGELILETLIVDGEEGYSLTPPGNYAGMRNIWFIPSAKTLLQWLEKTGFVNCQLIDTTMTTSVEQRPTEWMTGDSLSATLSRGNPDLTIENLPTPKRCVFIATRPKK